MKTEGFFFFQERIYFHCKKGLFFQNKGMKTEKIHIGMKRHNFFKGTFFGFVAIIKKYSFFLRYKIRIFAINWGFTGVFPSWHMGHSNTVELFFRGMSCLQCVPCQVLNQIQVTQSNLWTCEIMWTCPYASSCYGQQLKSDTLLLLRLVFHSVMRHKVVSTLRYW